MVSENFSVEATGDRLQDLVSALAKNGYSIVGPTVTANAIELRALADTAQLPAGWREEQTGGHYRLVKSNAKTRFGYSVTAQSWKRFLYPPSRTILSARRQGKHFEAEYCHDDPGPIAMLGVRPCELAAIDILDKVLLEGPYVDSDYQKRRSEAFIIAVNCTNPGDTCFCASMGTGPRATAGFDLVMTELLETGGEPEYMIETGSRRGRDLISELNLPTAGEEKCHAADQSIDRASESMGRSVNTEHLPEILQKAFDDRHWDEIAERCLTCGNCTMVCPTCFCTTVEDSTDLTGDEARRTRTWDSCFSVNFSYIHGGSVRAGEMSRYRQWMTHKLGYWKDQFNVLGCVGCGRCITWCPVGIDITEEAKIFRDKA